AGKGLLSTHLHSDGTDAEKLAMYYPGSSAGMDLENPPNWPDQELGGRLMTAEMLEDRTAFPYMDGQAVFQKAVVKFPEVIIESLTKNNLQPADIDLLDPHQATLRIAQFVQNTLKLRAAQLFKNIQKYGSTPGASVPIALAEAWE